MTKHRLLRIYVLCAVCLTLKGSKSRPGTAACFWPITRRRQSPKAPRFHTRTHLDQRSLTTVMAIEPYEVHVPDTELTKLKEKLSSIKLPSELEGSDWDMGTPLADVRRLALFWRDEFDWRKNESDINKMPQFKSVIQCEGFEPLDIHFVHQRSTVSGAIPLLFCHGWPGSFLEVQKLLPLLTASESGDAPVFHVVAPSLPNFGFSSRTGKRGFGLEQYAETCHRAHAPAWL